MIFHLFIVQDSLLLLTRVANHSAGIGLFSTLVENIIPHVNLKQNKHPPKTAL